MNRYKLINLFLNGFSLALAILVSDYVKRVMENEQFSFWVIFSATFLVLVLGITLLKTYLGYILSNIPFLRKIFLGKQYIEGTWIDRVRFPSGGEYFGVVRIDPDGEKLRYSGQNYDRNGESLGSFSSKEIENDWPVISFKYRTSPSSEHSFEGIVSIKFDEQDDGKPVYYTAECVDFRHSKIEKIEGWKIVDKEKLTALNNPQHRKELVKQMGIGYF